MGSRDDIIVPWSLWPTSAWPAQLGGRLTENTLRLWAAAEAMSLGRGGIILVAGATGLSRTTIHAGIKELEQPLGKERSGLGTARVRIRRPGGGRKPLTEQQPELLAELERLVDPLTRGDPRSPLRWTCKSTPALGGGIAEAAVTRSASAPCVTLLGSLGYSLQANRKSREGAQHPDRDAQFEHIDRQVADFSGPASRSFRWTPRRRNWSAILPVPGRNGSPKADPKRCGCMTSRTRSWARWRPMGSTIWQPTKAG